MLDYYGNDPLRPSTKKQLESLYRNLELELLAIVADFGVEELNGTSQRQSHEARRQ